jgi:ligand-binding sensor domain-containing protein
MNRTIIKLFLCLCIVTALPSYAYNTVHYYFRTVDIRNGLSQNSVNCIFQDKKGFMWFGTKDGLSRYDGLSFRIYNNENSNLGRNFITVLYEDSKGNIWVGTDGGLYIYNPILDSLTEFNLVAFGVIGLVCAIVYIQLSPKYHQVAAPAAASAGSAKSDVDDDLDDELD